MKRYYAELINQITLAASYVAPSDEYVFSVILANNKKATAWEDKIKGRVVVECENQPRDMPVFGIYWKPEQE